MLKISNLSKNYKGFLLKVKDLVFEVGKIYSLYGKNGAGKTTFLNIIAGIDENYNGQVINNFKKTGYAVQFIENVICKRTVKDEILSIVIEEKKAEKILLELNLDDKKEMSPFLLSSGEKRLLFIRAVCEAFDLILIDEPFINLDRKSKMAVINFIKMSKNLGKTVIYTTNRIKDVAHSDKVLEIENGEIKTRDN
ncbi:ATP-binding cassette domain-containing protein [Deferribacter thermophilus]|uniref:ATP-binding cassette domain-containing protein n=1 Tax=Deferribacter thermophilus TaxID=53573 RepID=UPI003C209A48